MHRFFSTSAGESLNDSYYNDDVAANTQLLTRAVSDFDCTIPSFASFPRIADMLSQELLDSMEKSDVRASSRGLEELR